MFLTCRQVSYSFSISFRMAIPRCEPWCWNIKTYIYPKNDPIIYSRFLYSSTMVRIWDCYTFRTSFCCVDLHALGEVGQDRGTNQRMRIPLATVHLGRIRHKLIYWLVVKQTTPLKNHGVKVSWDDDIPNLWKKMFQTTDQYSFVCTLKKNKNQRWNPFC